MISKLFASRAVYVVIVVMMMVTSIASVLQPETASAKAASSMGYVDQLRSYQYYYAMSDCVANSQLSSAIRSGPRDRAQAAIASGDWYVNNTAIVGYVADVEGSPDGRMECNNIVRQAINLWGYGQFTTAFSAMGFRENNSGTWSKSNNPRGDMLSSVRGLVYNNSDPVAPRGATYYQLFKAFTSACQPSEVGDGTLTADQRAKGSVQVYVVDDTSTPRAVLEKVYDIGKKSGSVAVGEVRNAGSDRSMECKTIADNLNRATANEYLGYLNSLPPGAATPGSITPPGKNDPDKTTCAIESIGWIVCPVMNFMAKIVDQAYGIIESLLQVEPLYTTGANQNTKALYDAWSVMRNIANVAFVIAFLIIIYSQLTGMGVSNYGIKRLMPRVIIAAVLVNISFWICAIGVDLSNIVGAGANSILNAPFSSTNLFDGAGDSATGQGWTGIVGATLAGTIAGGAILYATLSALLPALIAALFAIVTVFLVLTLRQALIILLVVIAPLAFVAFLLPNTEDWFKRWRSLFVTLLLMYPIIGFIFGGSALASQIVMASSDSVPVQIMGALISIIPLAITPIVLKSAGSILNRFGSMVNNPNKGPFDRLRRGAEGYRDKRKDIATTRRLKGTNMMSNNNLQNSKRRYIRKIGSSISAAGVIAKPGGSVASYLTGRNLDKERQVASAKAAKEYTEKSYVADNAIHKTGYAEKIAGPTGDANLARAYALQTKEEEFEKDVKAAQVLSRDYAKTMTSDQYADSMSAKTTDQSLALHERVAALREFKSVANASRVSKLTENIAELGQVDPGSENTTAIQRQFAEQFRGDSRLPSTVSATNMSQMYNGQFNKKLTERMLADINGGVKLDDAGNVTETFIDPQTGQIQQGKIGKQYVAKMDVDEMKDWREAFANDPTLINRMTDEGKTSVVESLQKAADDPRLNIKFGPREYDNMEQIATMLGGSFRRPTK